jgi:hypothetical protein
MSTKRCIDSVNNETEDDSKVKRASGGGRKSNTDSLIGQTRDLLIELQSTVRNISRFASVVDDADVLAERSKAEVKKDIAHKCSDLLSEIELYIDNSDNKRDNYVSIERPKLSNAVNAMHLSEVERNFRKSYQGYNMDDLNRMETVLDVLKSDVIYLKRISDFANPLIKVNTIILHSIQEMNAERRSQSYKSIDGSSQNIQ